MEYFYPIYKAVDGYLGDMTNITRPNILHLKRDKALQAYAPIESFAVDCSHNNRPDVHFKSTGINDGHKKFIKNLINIFIIIIFIKNFLNLINHQLLSLVLLYQKMTTLYNYQRYILFFVDLHKLFYND